MSRWTRAAAAVVATASIAAAGGCWYEHRAEGADARRFPAPGRFVEAGGRHLHVVCIGGGSPTILFEPSGFSNALSASVARQTIARRPRVCSYDRAGSGWSDAAPDPLSVGTLVDDVVHVLDATSPGARAVIVASSIGGLTAELLARRHPERVRGMIFVDAGTSDLLSQGEGLLASRRVAAACVAVPDAARVGLIRLLDPFDFNSSTSAIGARSAAVTYRPGPWDTLCALVRGYRQTRDEFARAPALSSAIPVVALSAERRNGLPPSWLDPNVARLPELMRTALQALARRSTAGVWRVVPGSDHLIANSRPQAVVDAVFEVMGRGVGS